MNDAQIFVIGDTPHDIECAAAIDARTIAVATGGYTVDELSTHHPWRVFEELPPLAEFLKLINVGPAFASDDASARQAATVPGVSAKQPATKA